MRLTAKDIRRFHASYVENGETGCWDWVREVNHAGRARIWAASAKRSASHVAMELAGKPRPSDDACALHSCDNPRCVNAAHISWGTQMANIADRVRKGRNGAPVGAANASAKLTPRMIPDIRRDGRSASEIAREYGVTPNTIISIRTGKTWSHV